MHLQAGAITAVLGSIVTFSFGIWPESLTVLLILMGIDYISGVAAAVKTGSGLSSSAGFWGLAKKGLILLVILLSHRIDIMLGTDLVMGGAIAFYLVNELLSVIENYGRLGLPLPERIRRVVRLFKDSSDNGKKDQAP